MWGAIIGGALSAAGGLLSGVLNRNARRQDFKDSERLSWEQWNATNAYNHPVAQMSRLREAGLNPNLVYGHMPMSPEPSFVRSQPPEQLDFGFDKLAEAVREQEAFDLNKESTLHAMALQEANLELAKENSLRNEREMDMRNSLLPFQQAEIASRIALNKAHENAVKDPRFRGVNDILGDLYSGVRNQGRETANIWRQIYNHPVVNRVSRRVRNFFNWNR